jgi:uncharacterized cupin superfamily protein
VPGTEPYEELSVPLAPVCQPCSGWKRSGWAQGASANDATSSTMRLQATAQRIDPARARRIKILHTCICRGAFLNAGAGQGCVAWAARIRFLTEARLEDAGSGLAPVTEGWFVVNVGHAEWFTSETRGAACWFANEYGDSPVEFPQFGINVTVLEPGQSGVYHAESNQEAFLVLGGECRLLVEGEERRLRAWDFFHSPPWTEHAFVGAGDRPCVILMVGAHVGPEARYPVSELAARYGASVEKETSDPEQVYATAERFRRGRPPYWSRLPWG